MIRENRQREESPTSIYSCIKQALERREAESATEKERGRPNIYLLIHKPTATWSERGEEERETDRTYI